MAQESTPVSSLTFHAQTGIEYIFRGCRGSSVEVSEQYGNPVDVLGLYKCIVHRTI